MGDRRPDGGSDRRAPVSEPTWDGLGAAELARRWGLPDLVVHDAVDSTNEDARRLAVAGAEPGTAVLAERQRAGRGRAGRTWDSPPGLGLWISMVARPPSDAVAAALLPLRVGSAVARALDPMIEGAHVGLKWPNDLVLEGRKLGGILCEGTWSGVSPGPVVVGVGLNLLQEPRDFPPEVRDIATSLASHARDRHARLEVGDRVVPALLRVVRGEADADADRDLATDLDLRDVLRGRPVEVIDPATGARLHHGTAMGIAPDGALLVREGDGALRLVRSGTVRVVERSKNI